LLHPLYLYFSPAGRAPAVTTFEKHHLSRLTTAKILGAMPLGVLTETPFNIGGDAGIE
jgi:hypothetical protein